jgi:hypothetical protein
VLDLDGYLKLVAIDAETDYEIVQVVVVEKHIVRCTRRFIRVRRLMG